MDPPASPSSLAVNIRSQHHSTSQTQVEAASPPGNSGAGTPRTAHTLNASSLPPSPSPFLPPRHSPLVAPEGADAVAPLAPGRAVPFARPPSAPRRRSRSAAKIIKGEIHNVLTVMRSDPRYYAAPGGGVRSRFEHEERRQATAVAGHGAEGRRRSSGAVASSHPVMWALRDLHDRLSTMEAEGFGAGVGVAGGLATAEETASRSSMNAATFILPFTAAVWSRDVDVRTTGEALSALHKFLVYGFVGHSNDDDDDEVDCGGGAPFASSAGQVRESLGALARCVRHCTFDNGDSSVATAAESRSWFRAGREKRSGVPRDGGTPPRLGANRTENDRPESCTLPSFLTKPRRGARKSKGGPSKETGGRHSTDFFTPYSSSLSPSDEEVVLKLLSLSVQVLRCPASRNSLLPSDAIGIFDTCLHVAISASEGGRTLLRSAAADALSHCVIVLFGIRSTARGRRGDGAATCAGRRDESAQTEETTEDSDDDWGERDPTEEEGGNAAQAWRALSSERGARNSGTATKDENFSVTARGMQWEEEPALVPIMHRLAVLADPLLHEDAQNVLALSLVNIALETMPDVDALSVRYPRLLTIMQNDLCRNLLRLSTSPDLSIFGLGLRVIFNLFNSIKDHLKLQLEVFLTSVHLRTLSFSTPPNSRSGRVWSSSPERRELALESLLEFCREPSLMSDLYLNYDCDINCTNLFETICSTLSVVAAPEETVPKLESESCNDAKQSSENAGGVGGAEGKDKPCQKPRLNILNRLALEGILAVIDAIARRCRVSCKYKGLGADKTLLNAEEDLLSPSPPDSGNSAFLGNTLWGADKNDPGTNLLSKARFHTSLALRERKLKKRCLAKAAVEFNKSSRDKEWIEEAERLGVLPTPATPGAVAQFLYSTPKLDKTKIGLMLSKGPKENHPFHSEVLVSFASLFDFSGMTFSGALRIFLGRFRLPGEAQCIDRLMESFAIRLYEVQMLAPFSSKDDGQSVEKTVLNPLHCGNLDAEFTDRKGTLDPPASDECTSEADRVFPFKNSDAVFILSFSTIMLNTDLHNPNMQDDKRMTLEEFIRNNRGINDGSNLPTTFLTELYYEIKNKQIQVNQADSEIYLAGADAFDGLLAKANTVATPFFTSNNPAHLTFEAELHERDMYVSIFSAATHTISSVFVESWDDVLVTKALDGLQNSGLICSYFQLQEQFNQLLELMFGFGLDYLGSIYSLMSKELVESDFSGKHHPSKPNKECLLQGGLNNVPDLPKSFLSALNADTGSQNACDMSGSAVHRGLLSLQCALTLSKHHLSYVREAWPIFLEVVCALRDVRALPPLLSDLDDFADSRGNALPMSIFSYKSHQRVKEYTESIAPSDKSSSSGFFSSLFGFRQSSTSHDEEAHANNSQRQLPLTEALQKVAHCAQIDKIIMKTTDVAMAKEILVAMFDSVYPDGSNEGITYDPLFEHNAVFVLELAARVLISNRVHAAELYPIFFEKFSGLISPQLNEENGSTERVVSGDIVQFPYVLERIVVTILRACIHLFDVPEICLRTQLNHSLSLIPTLPSSFVSAISDRIGCGAAIIFRGCFYLFDDSKDDWSTIKALLDLAAQDKSGRGFVFDGIASVVDGIDYAVPSAEESDNANKVHLSQCGVQVIASLLLKFMNGGYEDDVSFKAPALQYITKIYSFSQHFADKEASEDSANSTTHLQENEFEKMVAAIYKDACLAQDNTTAKSGFESLQGLVLSTNIESIPVVKWFTFLNLVATQPPSITSLEARVCSLSLIGRLCLTLIPQLSNQKENWSQLEDWIMNIALIVSDNLQAGRASPLFETTVQTVTNIVNVISMSGFNEGEGVNFCVWVGETLFYELEKVGAGGGATSMLYLQQPESIKCREKS